MFSQVKDLAGGEFFLISSLIIFLLFFIVMCIYLSMLSKSHISTMSKLPIEDHQTNTNEKD